MSEVTRLDDYRPHCRGPAICTACEHEWYAVIIAESHLETMECPSCRKFFGVMRGVQVPETMWRCKCESNLFYLTPDGHKCRNCGLLSWEWLARE